MIFHDDNCDDPRIRPVEAAHIAELIRIGEETNLSPWSAQSYLDELRNPASILLRLVSDDNETIGFIVGRKIIGALEKAENEAEIYNIAVVEPERSKGCGQRLFDAFAAICRRDGVVNIWLEVRESNQKALRFYERNGFARVQARTHFYANPREHAILMRLILK